MTPNNYIKTLSDLKSKKQITALNLEFVRSQVKYSLGERIVFDRCEPYNVSWNKKFLFEVAGVTLNLSDGVLKIEAFGPRVKQYNILSDIITGYKTKEFNVSNIKGVETVLGFNKLIDLVKVEEQLRDSENDCPGKKCLECTHNNPRRVMSDMEMICGGLGLVFENIE